MKRVIVTGANGFIGSSLIKKLIHNNIEVLAIDISFQKSNLPDSTLITELEAGIDDLEYIQEKIGAAQYDTFYHFAWKGVNGPQKADPIVQIDNIKMAMNCANLAQRTGCKRILCAGTIAEQATNSLSQLKATSGGMLYGVAKYSTHLLLETYCKNIGLDFVWMQFSNIYGPNNKTGNLVSYTVGELMQDHEAKFGPAAQPYDFIFVDDLIEAILRLGETETIENYYFIGSGEPRILSDYLKEIGRVMGKEELIRIGERPDDGIMYTMDMFDTRKLVNTIGKYTTMTFSEGIQYTINNY